MSNYIGVRCPVCNKKFTAADDIVVCPVCGAPHHRDCYTLTNSCAFAADHLSGKEWAAPIDQSLGTLPGEQSGTRENPAVKSCTRCGAVNPADGIYCQVCGNSMTAPAPQGGQNTQNGQPNSEWIFPGFSMQLDTISMAYGGLSPDEQIDGESVKDLALYVGPNSAYYLPRFRIMSETNRTLTPNLAALFFNFFYYFYRKMYLLGAILLGLYIVSSIPNYLFTWEMLPKLMFDAGIGPEVAINQVAADHFLWLGNITKTINFFIGFIVSLCANRFYYAKSTAAVHNLRTELAKDKTPQEYDQMLASAGGCGKTAVIAVASTMLAAYVIFSFVMAYFMLTM